MRIAVTGACGFIGSHLCEALRDEGHDVTGLCLYNRDESYGWLDGAHGIDKVLGDVRDAEHTAVVIAGHEIVYHLAALIDVADSFVRPRSYFETNAMGTFNVLEACRGRKMILVSSSEVYGTARFTPQHEQHPLQAQSPYAASKIAAEKMVESYARTYDMDAVILRPFNTFGPRQSTRAVIASMVSQAVAGGPVKVGSRASTRDWTYVSDTVAALAAAVDLRLGPWNVATGETHAVTTALSRIMEKTGVVPVHEDSTRKRPDGAEVHVLCGDSTKFRHATGWEPKVSFEDGIAKTVDWWREL